MGLFTPVMRRFGLALSVATIAIAALPAASQAAVAGRDSIEGETLLYGADVGEQNRLRVSREGERIVFQDDGATITPGRGCTSVTPNRVSCEESFFVGVELEDGDDEASSSGDVTGTAGSLSIEGGTGNDTLRGSADRSFLSGGPGTDVLEGGPGTAFIDATERLTRGEEDEMPEQAPEADTVSCVTHPDGASVDQLDQVSGPCDPVLVYTTDFVLARGTEDDDLITVPSFPSRIEGLGGNDFIFTGGPHTRAEGGGGNDKIVGLGLLLGGQGDDRLDAGAGERGAGGRLSGDPGDDFLTGSDGPDRFSGGPGADRISGRGANDLIRVRDGERDTVRCGTGSDTVIADRRDVVRSDCNRVVRG
jgi:hypothetical protein